MIQGIFRGGDGVADSGAHQSVSAGNSSLTFGVVTSTTLEGDESPEAFHA